MPVSISNLSHSLFPANAVSALADPLNKDVFVPAILDCLTEQGKNLDSQVVYQRGLRTNGDFVSFLVQVSSEELVRHPLFFRIILREANPEARKILCGVIVAASAFLNEFKGETLHTEKRNWEDLLERLKNDLKRLEGELKSAENDLQRLEGGLENAKKGKPKLELEEKIKRKTALAAKLKEQILSDKCQIIDVRLRVFLVNPGILQRVLTLCPSVLGDADYGPSFSQRCLLDMFERDRLFEGSFLRALSNDAKNPLYGYAKKPSSDEAKAPLSPQAKALAEAENARVVKAQKVYTLLTTLSRAKFSEEICEEISSDPQKVALLDETITSMAESKHLYAAKMLESAAAKMGIREAIQEVVTAGKKNAEHECYSLGKDSVVQRQMELVSGVWPDFEKVLNDLYPVPGRIDKIKVLASSLLGSDSDRLLARVSQLLVAFPSLAPRYVPDLASLTLPQLFQKAGSDDVGLSRAAVLTIVERAGRVESPQEIGKYSEALDELIEQRKYELYLEIAHCVSCRLPGVHQLRKDTTGRCLSVVEVFRLILEKDHEQHPLARNLLRDPFARYAAIPAELGKYPGTIGKLLFTSEDVIKTNEEKAKALRKLPQLIPWLLLYRERKSDDVKKVALGVFNYRFQLSVNDSGDPNIISALDSCFDINQQDVFTTYLPLFEAHAAVVQPRSGQIQESVVEVMMLSPDTIEQVYLSHPERLRWLLLPDEKTFSETPAEPISEAAAGAPIKRETPKTLVNYPARLLIQLFVDRLNSCNHRVTPAETGLLMDLNQDERYTSITNETVNRIISRAAAAAPPVVPPPVVPDRPELVKLTAPQNEIKEKKTVKYLDSMKNAKKPVAWAVDKLFELSKLLAKRQDLDRDTAKILALREGLDAFRDWIENKKVPVLTEEESTLLFRLRLVPVDGTADGLRAYVRALPDMLRLKILERNGSHLERVGKLLEYFEILPPSKNIYYELESGPTAAPAASLAQGLAEAGMFTAKQGEMPRRAVAEASYRFQHLYDISDDSSDAEAEPPRQLKK